MILPMEPVLVMGPALGIRMRDDWHGSVELASQSIREALNRRTLGHAVLDGTVVRGSAEPGVHR